MIVSFESKEISSVSDKELENILKCLNKKSYIYIRLVNIFMAIMLVLGIIMLFYKSPWIFVICVVYFLGMYFLSKNNIAKFREILNKISNYVFEDDYFYANEKQLNYTDIDMLEVGCGFVRIKIGKYKLVLIFKGRDKGEMDMLVAKLKANAKKYKELT